MVNKEVKKETTLGKSGKGTYAEHRDYTPLLVTTKEQQKKIDSLLKKWKQASIPEKYWEHENVTNYYVPVDDGEICVHHIKPANPTSSRPVVFIPGWQTMIYQFEDAFKILFERVEMYIIDSRESYNSKLNRKKADMSLHQKAKDVQKAIEFFGLDEKDYVLFGSCWGASIIYQGLLDKTLKAPTYVTFSPMHKLWLNKFVQKFILPILPSFIVGLAVRILRPIAFSGMKAETQKARMTLTVKEADFWKWRRVAIATKNFELFGKLHDIEEEVIVIAGTHDRVHKSNDYPRFADEMPNGRFVFFGIGEDQREATMGLSMLELSKISAEKGMPSIFEEFEINL